MEREKDKHIFMNDRHTNDQLMHKGKEKEKHINGHSKEKAREKEDIIAGRAKEDLMIARREKALPVRRRRRRKRFPKAPRKAKDIFQVSYVMLKWNFYTS